jgi:hypothetical protein
MTEPCQRGWGSVIGSPQGTLWWSWKAYLAKFAPVCQEYYKLRRRFRCSSTPSRRKSIIASCMLIPDPCIVPSLIWLPTLPGEDRNPGTSINRWGKQTSQLFVSTLITARPARRSGQRKPRRRGRGEIKTGRLYSLNSAIGAAFRRASDAVERPVAIPHDTVT